VVEAVTRNYSIRHLTPEDWQEFAAIRLEALKRNRGVFTSNYEKEHAYDEHQWKSHWLSQGNKSVFGLFDGLKLIGITGVFTYKDDASGKTGIMGLSYIQPDYRGQGLSDFLYRAHIDWAVNHKEWTKLIIGHRETNEPSRRANQRHGFQFTHRVNRTWPDGAQEDELCYEIDLEQLRQKQ